ncbi:hypothetical protein ONA92_04005 [Mycobacteroides salmoniphilum]|uniref:hypothetical protein n=1 Tax=Mycobacteroides salmoniphilum TaxID=404941 RepID=UPI00356360F9
MSEFSIDPQKVGSAMQDTSSHLEDMRAKFDQMNQAISDAVNSHRSPNADEIRNEAHRIDEDLRDAHKGMIQATREVYEKGNALLQQVNRDPIAGEVNEAQWPERDMTPPSEDEVIYGKGALQCYEDAHDAARAAGTAVEQINQLFNTQLPLAFVGKAGESVVSTQKLINDKFTEAHNLMNSLLGDKAPEEINGVFDLDARLGS